MVKGKGKRFKTKVIQGKKVASYVSTKWGKNWKRKRTTRMNACEERAKKIADKCKAYVDKRYQEIAARKLYKLKNHSGMRLKVFKNGYRIYWKRPNTG